MRSPGPAALLAMVLAAAALAGCSKPRPPEPVGGVYAVGGTGTVSWGPNKKKPKVRRAQAGVLLMSNMTLEAEKGAVLEAFDGSFVWVPAGAHKASKLKLPVGADDEAVRSVLIVTDRATPKDLPPPVVLPRYEPFGSDAPLESADDKEFKSDVAFFFFPRGDDEAKDDSELKPPPPPPWEMKEMYVHPLRRPLKAGDGRRLLEEAKGAVVVEFLDKATAFADSLKLPLDLADAKRVVVADGSARLALPTGKLELKSGDIAEIAPLP